MIDELIKKINNETFIFKKTSDFKNKLNTLKNNKNTELINNNPKNTDIQNLKNIFKKLKIILDKKFSNINKYKQNKNV